MTILLAASDRDLLRSYEALLTLDGHEVRTAFDGAQVASLMGGGPYDAAILESALPRVGHEQLIQLLRRENVPVIVMLDRRVSARHLLSASLPEAYLPLPFLPNDLRALLDSVAEKRRAGRPFSAGDAAVDVARFRFEGTDTRLTAGEIDLLAALNRGEPVQGRRARVMIHALNEKLRRLGRATRIEYQPQKGYKLVSSHE